MALELEVVEDCTHETGSSYLGVYTVVEPWVSAAAAAAGGSAVGIAVVVRHKA